MKLPNIYQGNYSILVLLPIVLIVTSIFLIPNLKYGIDLKGGMLISIQTSQSIDEQALRSAVSAQGIKDAEVRFFTDLDGYVAEIEIPIDERITTIDDKISSIESISEQISTLESELARYRAEQMSTGKDVSSQISADEAKISSLMQNAVSLQNEIFSASAELIGGIPATAKYEGSEIVNLQKACNAVFSEAKLKYKEKLLNSLTLSYSIDEIKLEEVSPSLSSLFINKVINIALISAFLAIIVVFLVFRTLVPSLAVLVGATSDLTMALGAMSLFGIPLTLSSFATLMMIVALSLDTDMMLTIKTVKRREGTPRERAYDAFKTGFAMTTTVIVAFAVLTVLGSVTHISTYYQIGAVAVAGLIGDLIATWALNAVLVLWYLEGKYEILARMVKR